MRVLVVQNFDNEGLGQIGAALVEAGADIDLRRPYKGDTLPQDSGAHDAMVVLGGAQNALDDASCPYFPDLLDLTRDFAGKDRSVLGICLGSPACGSRLWRREPDRRRHRIRLAPGFADAGGEDRSGALHTA